MSMFWAQCGQSMFMRSRKEEIFNQETRNSGREYGLTADYANDADGNGNGFIRQDWPNFSGPQKAIP